MVKRNRKKEALEFLKRLAATVAVTWVLMWLLVTF